MQLDGKARLEMRPSEREAAIQKHGDGDGWIHSHSHPTIPAKGGLSLLSINPRRTYGAFGQQGNTGFLDLACHLKAMEARPPAALALALALCSAREQHEDNPSAPSP